MARIRKYARSPTETPATATRPGTDVPWLSARRALDALVIGVVRHRDDKISRVRGLVVPAGSNFEGVAMTSPFSPLFLCTF
jgi:hypothetical protein